MDYYKTYADVYRKEKFCLPRKFIDADEVSKRLLALYQIDVENKGGKFIPDRFILDVSMEIAEWIVSPKNYGILIYGPCGNGKSTMLRAINMLFQPYTRILHSMDAFRIYEENGRFPFARVSNTGIYSPVLLDDIGTEPVKYNFFGSERYPMHDILTEMYSKNIMNVVTTNLSTESISDKYGSRIGDRIKEMKRIKFTNKSYR